MKNDHLSCDDCQESYDERNALKAELERRKAHCSKYCMGYPIEGYRNWVSKESYEALESKLETLKVDAAYMEMDLKGKLEIAREALGNIDEVDEEGRYTEADAYHCSWMKCQKIARDALARIEGK